jgi:hypothetical protein
MTFESKASHIAVTIFGLLNAAAGGFFLWLYLRPPGHVVQPTVIYALVAWIFFGGAIAIPKVYFATASQMIALFRSYKSSGTPPTGGSTS